MVLVTIAYFATSTGLVPAATIMPPWVTPPIIGGIMASVSWQGGGLAAVNLLVSTIIYLPFTKIATSMALKEEAAREQQEAA
ncbi:PTS sugar transporter subunit IIC [Latilactobacillus sakei]|nr:PTS sugar transporter subunit IIC [Latilactobacillus sakei]UNC23950.1 PTS sugar transporter subunit IIC [Latilactobacillus sakei]